MWIYFFPERQSLTLRCPNFGNQPHRTISLQGTGLVYNLSTCYLSSSTLRTLTELTGLLHAKLETPNLYLPSNISAVSKYETTTNILPADTSRIDDMTLQLGTRKQTFDMDSLFHVHEISQQQEQRTRWLVILTTSISIAVILGIFCFNLYSHCHSLRCYALPNASITKPSLQNPTSSTECNQQVTAEQSKANAKQDVLFTAYPMHATN